MRIRLSVHGSKAAALETELKKLGIEIDPEAEYELIERTQSAPLGNYLEVKDERGEHLSIPFSDIIFAESFGRRIDIHVKDKVYTCSERLYSLEENMNSHGFIRVSNSVIVARKQIKKIKPTLSMKFVLTMSDGSLVDVTRSYYHAFKQAIGI